MEDGDHVRVGDSVFICVTATHASPPDAAGAEFDDPPPLAASTICLRPDQARYPRASASDSDEGEGASRTARDLRTLLDIGAAIYTIRRREALQERLLELIMKAIRAECGAILMADGPNGELVSAVERSAALLRISRTITQQGALNIITRCSNLRARMRLTDEPVERSQIPLAATTLYKYDELRKWFGTVGFEVCWHRNGGSVGLFLLRLQ